MLRTIIAGLGECARKDHLPALRSSKHFRLVGVNDPDAGVLKRFSGRYSIYGHADLTEVIRVCRPDVAIVAAPHKEHLPIVEQLAASGVHIIKEKPFAISFKEAVAMQDLARKRDIRLEVVAQRRSDPLYQACSKLIGRLGKIYAIEGRYAFNIDRLDKGWRARKVTAGGGALLDMGYHMIDLLIWYFGLPDTVSAKLSTGNREGQLYDVEDTAHLLFDYSSSGEYREKTVGNLIISRAYPRREESLLIVGSRGSIELEKNRLAFNGPNGRVVEEWQRLNDQASPMINQLKQFAKAINDKGRETGRRPHRHLQHLAVIQAAYDSDERGKPVNPMTYIQESERSKK